MIAVLTAPGIGDRMPEVRLADEAPADLSGTTQLGAGVSVEIDLADPDGWRAVAVDRWERADGDLLGAVVGQDSVRYLSQLRAGAAPDSQLTADVSVDAAKSAPWRRLAVIDALDRWLQVPLDQALLDAERAVVRARAARTLRSSSLREHRNGQAVVLARRSAGELSTYLTGLANSASSLPRALYSSLSRVTTGYANLATQVTGGPDECFDAVAQAWSRLKVAVPVGGVLKRVEQLPAVEFDGEDSSSVDPRQVRARVIASEIRMVESRGGSTVRVLVPAFGSRVPSVIADQLMVRLVDRRSGVAHAPVRLKFSPGRAVFMQDVPLRGASADDVRADVFDPGYETAPALTDGDDELVRQRRAQFVLSEWRRAMVEIRLSRQPKTRNRRLARLTAVLNQSVPDANEPVFRGGPTRGEITRYVDAAPGTVHPWFTSTRGAGEPLVAELAAVHQAR
ncbi:hypothetical protein ACFCV3_07650 [Kribbella sp. NPDC056345]|uniref:hypothetical protein n=1 Tax=Kribbella sp. NPDC056345 TaxID=3345789 RepID=UPI0035E2EB45